MWVLRATDVLGPTRWRWLLEDDVARRVVVEHEVDLDADCVECEAFAQLDRYLRHNAAPHDRATSEATIVDDIGAWLGEQVLGKEIGAALADGDEDVVRVELPTEAMFLLDRPLELAHADGVSLARREISLAFTWPGDRSGGKTPVHEELRILALFSMPSGESPLALRRERYELAAQVRHVAERRGKAVHIRVLQYGVTRERLRALAETAPGWDVLHLAGHGNEGRMLLERPDGSPDPVSTAELVELLHPARKRLKLAVLGTCSSGAAAAAETLSWLRLPVPPSEPPAAAASATVGLARGLVEAFGIAAVANRYPVSDAFSVAFSRELYPRLLDGTPLDRALGLAVPAAAGDRASRAHPALSLGTPTLFGARAVGLRLTAPDRRMTFDVHSERMPGLPAEPKRFVGRTRLLIDASAALAEGSERTGVLLLGEAGVGKSTAATELAYLHQETFAGHAWWSAPERDLGPGIALADLAQSLESQLPGFVMEDVVAGADGFRRFLPGLTNLLRRKAVLVVLDGLEALLSRSGTWRDPLWADLFRALTDHDGLSRVVLTSRTMLPGLGLERVAVVPVHQLSLAESALLIRELPNLDALLHEDRGATVEVDRGLVREVVQIMQGHPTLIGLAEAAAADPAALRERLADGAPLAALLRTDQFLHVLAAWTNDTLARLSQPARRLAELLAHLELADRQSTVVSTLWPQMWEVEPVPSLSDALDMLTAVAVVEIETRAVPAPGGPTARVMIVGSGPAAIYRISPGVTEVLRDGIDADRRAALDGLAGDFWRALSDDGTQREDEHDPTGSPVVVHASLAAAPYLIRRGDRRAAADLLTRVAGRDRSPGTLSQVLAYLRQCWETETDDADRLHCEAVHAIVLAHVEPDAESRLRELIERAGAAGRMDLRAALAGHLQDHLRDHGRLTDAFTVAAELGQDDREGGDDVVSRLMLSARAGRPAEVLKEACDLLERMEADGEPGWNALERVLDVACYAARELADWDRALAFNLRIRESERQRGASAQSRPGRGQRGQHRGPDGPPGRGRAVVVGVSGDL